MLYEVITRIGLKAVLVVDNVAAGPSVGGIRMAVDVSTEECFRLARAMTLKNAAAGLAHGGGKAVLYGSGGGMIPDHLVITSYSIHYTKLYESSK